jgi:hypothetical protein
MALKKPAQKKEILFFEKNKKSPKKLLGLQLKITRFHTKKRK